MTPATANGDLHPRSRILVVDDEILIRLVLAEALRDEGYAVVEAANADEAYDLLAAGVAVDLLITDVRMPGRRDGFGLARDAEALRPGLPVLISSADTRSGDPDRHYLPKPYSNERLLMTVAQLLASR